MASPAYDETSARGRQSVGPAVLDHLAAPAALLIGAVLVGSAGALGVIETTGATAATTIPAAVWLVTLPAVLAAALSVLRLRIGAAFAGGAGALAVGRLLTDLFVLAEPSQVVRPEFYFPSRTEVHPIGTSPLGATLLILGDLLLVTGGVLGLRAAERSVRGRLAPSGPIGPPPDAGFGFGAGARARAAFGSDADPDPTSSTVPGVPGDGGSTAAATNVRMVAVGLLGVAIAVVLTVQVPYTGGYLDDFYSLPSDLGSTLGPFLLALLSAGVVIRAAGFPRSMATALLGGAAAMLLVPMLTAVVAVSGGARTALATSPLFLPIGLVVMVGAGLLSVVRFADPGATTRRTLPDATAGRPRAGGLGVSSRPGNAAVRSASGQRGAAKATEPTRAARSAAPAELEPTIAAAYQARPSEPIGLVGAGLAALAGVAAVLAPLFGMLRVNGEVPGVEQQALLRLDPVVGTGVDSVLAVPAMFAGISLIACAIAGALGRALRRESLTTAARMASVLMTVLPLVALAGPLSTLAVLSTGLAQTASALSVNAPAGFEVDVWSSGPGVWSLVAALALGIAAATCSSTALARRGEEMTWGPDDDAADADRNRRWSVAAAVIVLAVLSTSITVWELPQGTSSTVLAGDAAWTCWLLVAGAAVAAVVIAVAHSPAVASGAAVGAAVLLASRLILPSGVTGAPGFVRPWGWYLGWVAVAVILGIGVLTASWVANIARLEPTMGSAPHVDNRPKPIRDR